MTFNTDQFVCKHLDVIYASVNFNNPAGISLKTAFTQQRNLWTQLSSASGPLTSTKRKALYSKKEAEAWKVTGMFSSNFLTRHCLLSALLDALLTNSILDAAEEGQYHEFPTVHPSFNIQELETTPLCLQAFHLPGAASLAYGCSGHSQHSQIGTAITQLNRVVGISLLEFCEV